MENKYKVGDKVKYVCTGGNKEVGIITEIRKTDVYEWNKDKEVKTLYKLDTYGYYRYEEEVVGLVE